MLPSAPPSELQQDESSQDGLQQQTVGELKTLAKKLDVAGYSTMTKSELIQAIQQAHNQQEHENE